MLSFLSRESTVATKSYNRWLVPPAAIAVHMCIGQVYAFSVFKTPLSQALGITKSIEGDWSHKDVGMAYSIALALLGLSAAVFGKWIEKNGPRKTMFYSMLLFCSGLLISALAVNLHSLWLLWLGYGFIGGIGLGLGYIAPVSTLMKWFPDRPGMATGMAIMGFGGGAMIGGPIAQELMAYYSTPINDAIKTTTGAAPAMITMAIIYVLIMSFAAWAVRVPQENWKPENWIPVLKKGSSTHSVSDDTA
jgi:MFS family permease